MKTTSLIASLALASCALITSVAHADTGRYGNEQSRYRPTQPAPIVRPVLRPAVVLPPVYRPAPVPRVVVVHPRDHDRHRFDRRHRRNWYGWW